MPIVYDVWNNEVEITKGYVNHRNRLIDVHLIHTFQTKGKRLLINSFKQNECVPTMCIFFESNEKAEEAYELMKAVYYGPLVPAKPVGARELLAYMIVFVVVPFVLFLTLVSRTYRR